MKEKEQTENKKVFFVLQGGFVYRVPEDKTVYQVAEELKESE